MHFRSKIRHGVSRYFPKAEVAAMDYVISKRWFALVWLYTWGPGPKLIHL